MITHIAASSIMEVLFQNPNNNVYDGTKWNFEKRAGMLYVVARAISVGTNGNADYFGYDELKKAWKTFIGKGVFVNHQSQDITAQRGKVIDAQFIDNGDNENTYIACLMEINAEAYPELASMIKSGHAQSVSMGTRCGFSYCSVCNHKASSVKDYCTCLKHHKGGYIGFKRVYEINHDLDFQELSLVSNGACPYAKVLEIIAKQARLTNMDERELWSMASKDASFVDRLMDNQRELELTVLASIKLAKQMKEG